MNLQEELDKELILYLKDLQDTTKKGIEDIFKSCSNEEELKSAIIWFVNQLIISFVDAQINTFPSIDKEKLN
jgi:hypothetical protein